MAERPAATWRRRRFRLASEWPTDSCFDEEMFEAPRHDAVRIDGLLTRAEGDRGRRIEQLCTDDARLHPGNGRADAEVAAPAEGQMVLAVLAVEPERIRIIDMGRIPIRRRPEEHQTIPGMELESAELAIALHDAVVEVEGRLQTRHLLHEARNQLATLAQDVRG